MRNRTVFLSHSSKSDAERERVVVLAHELETAGYTVRLDKTTLEAGQRWEDEIDRWLGECDAAILLLTPGVIGSHWVQWESKVLRWRQKFDPSLKLFTSFLDGFTPPRLRGTPLGELGLGAIQSTKGQTGPELAKEVQGLLGPPQVSLTDLDQLCKFVVEQLSPLNEIQIEGVYDRLEADLPSFSGPGRLRLLLEGLAWRFLRMGAHQVHQVVDALWAYLPSKSREHIAEAIAAFWVNQAAAGVIPPAAATVPAPALALNASHLQRFTAKAYLVRAYWPRRLFGCIPVEGAHGVDPVGHVRMALKWERRRGRGSKAPPGMFRRFVLLEGVSWLEPDIIEQLRKEMPEYIFMVGTGPVVPDVSGPDHASSVTVLLPALDAEDEQHAADAYCAARESCRSD